MMTPPSIMCLMLLLATSAAGAVQPDRCEGDCKGARAQVLLQTGSVGRQRFAAHGSGEEFKDVQRVASMSLSEESSLVEDLVTEVLSTGQPLTGVQEEIIERLNESFVTETLPGLQKRHDSDQELLNVHAASFAHCDVDLETNSQKVSTLNSDQSSIESAHTECLAQEGSLQSSEKLMHEELTAYLKSIQSPSSMMPEQRAPTPAMDDFVAQNLEFFRSLSSSYDSLKEQISTVEAEVEAKTANCSEVGLEFDEKFCLWKTEVENAKSNYLNCRTEVGTLYRETLKAAHSNAEGRRADLAAVLKVQCYLRMLLDGTTQEKLKECNDAEHTSSALDIAEPQLLDLNQRVLDGLGAPGSQVQCTAAGSSDAGSLYGTYAAGDAATTYPATTYPAATTYLATTYPATTYLATTYPATTYPATTYPATTYPATTEAATTYPATTYPATTEAATTYPATTYPATTYPATTYPATTYPATTYPETTYPETTYPATTYAATTYPATTYPATTVQ
ncbi:unnamed protein product [Polarella glacialis]|uniref:Uncharacterized protein n=2 Tax=Polarella glacialis TaxID=89957 RepID=A0A813JVP4_POLGL|nr:unnamed protein product [Polarella glacialis]